MRRKESFLCCCRRQGKTTTHFFLSPSFSLVEGTHKQNSLFVERYARLPDGVVRGRDGTDWVLAMRNFPHLSALHVPTWKVLTARMNAPPIKARAHTQSLSLLLNLKITPTFSSSHTYAGVCTDKAGGSL